MSSDFPPTPAEGGAGDARQPFYATILENIDVDLAVFDTDLRYRYINRTAVKNPEVRSWMIGRTDAEYCEERGKDPELGRRRMENMRTVLREARTVEFEEEIPTPDGVRWFVRKISPVVDDEGRVTSLIGYGFDISPLKRALATLQRSEGDRRHLEEQLRQSQKLEAVGQLAGGVAHDFNNLLTAILGHGSLLLAALSKEPALRDEVREINRAAERAAALTRQLLAFSRKQMLKPELMDLNATVHEMERLLHRLLGDDLELATELSPEAVYVLADPGQVQQAIVNLAVNARDAMPGGGRLTLRTAVATLSEEDARRRPDVAPGEYVLLEVSDTGAGIPPELLDRVFEPFFTTKEVGKGTGLGLSTVYGIVRQSGGHVSVESEPGAGATFTILLPRAAAPSPSAGPRRRGAGEARGGSETVLVAEDDASVRRLILKVLRSSGYRVLEGDDDAAVLRWCEEHPGPIHLFVTDVVMPGLGGVELARRVTELRPETEVLYVSGYTRDQLARKTGLGPDISLLEKPFTPEALAGRVREMLEGREAESDG